MLDGKRVSAERLQIIKNRLHDVEYKPHLVTVLVGSDPGSQIYVKMKHTTCEEVGIRSTRIDLPESTTTSSLLSVINDLNQDPQVNGILVQLPLPQHIETSVILSSVEPKKDIDGFNPLNQGLLISGNPGFIPCTPKGIMTLLKTYNINVSGLDAVVIGRSTDVGRPMSALLLLSDATVTICHSKTRNIEQKLMNADLIVSAVGKADFLKGSMIKEGTVVIDVGITRIEGKVHGDVEFDSVSKKAGALTPVPGGVGPMTILSLIENTLLASGLQSCIPV